MPTLSALASQIRADVRYGLRALYRSPGFAFVGIVSTGIGMGLTTLMYDTKWQLVSRELPAAANAERLVMPTQPVSYFYIEQYRQLDRLFAGVAAVQTGVPFTVSVPDDAPAKAQRVYGQLVSAASPCLASEQRVGACWTPRRTSPATHRLSWSAIASGAIALAPRLTRSGSGSGSMDSW
ncbi:MAG TPA: hypothetical protein VH539_21755 [Gemmatimonadaceae bacterium]